MESSSFRTKIASVPDREHLVVELWYLTEMVAEANVEEGSLVFEFYPRQGGGPWQVPTDVLGNFVQLATRELHAVLTVERGDA